MTSRPTEPVTSSPCDPAAALAAAVPLPDDDALVVLRRTLAGRADDEGLLDIGYDVLDSPIGPLLVAATDVGIVRIAFEGEGHEDVLAELATSIGPRVLHAPRRTADAARQLAEYFDGTRRRFELPVDLRAVSGFRRHVLDHLDDIAYGATASYAEVAAAAGNPGAVRAVGSACSHNPVPVVVPCHRVVRSDGAIGRYLGGTDAKVALLALEAA